MNRPCIRWWKCFSGGVFQSQFSGGVDLRSRDGSYVSPICHAFLIQRLFSTVGGLAILPPMFLSTACKYNQSACHFLCLAVCVYVCLSVYLFVSVRPSVFLYCLSFIIYGFSGGLFNVFFTNRSFFIHYVSALMDM